MAMESHRTFVIVGAGLAGTTAAQTLRTQGFDGRVVLLGAEAEAPYDRPPLTKGYLRGETPREQVYLHDGDFYRRNGIELRTSAPVTSIEPSARTVTLADGEEVGFDRLLLAPGAEPRRLPVPGAGLEGVCYLRNLADSDVLRERLGRGGRLVVVGAGWIGVELAAFARQKCLEVTLLDPSPLPLARVLGSEVGGFYRDLHAAHGVELLLGVGVAAFEGGSAVERVVTSDGRRIDADVVAVGIGVQPRTELAERAGLAVDDGIVVDELLRTSEPGIFAAGDAARARHPFYGEHVRVEHWATARDQGEAVAGSMLDRAAPYDKLPYFFSDQYDVGMEYRGRAPRWDDVVFRGDPASGEFLAFWLADGRVLAGMNVNVWDVGDDIDTLIRSGAEVEPRRLADPDVPLRAVSAEPVAGNGQHGNGQHGNGRSGRGGLGAFVAGRVNFVRRFVADRVTAADPTPVEGLARGEGRVLSVGGEKVAVYKDDAGTVHAVSPVCTHARCLVHWNAADTAWDCPCHGSRFDHTGRVLRGPARKDLEPKQLPSTPETV